MTLKPRESNSNKGLYQTFLVKVDLWMFETVVKTRYTCTQLSIDMPIYDTALVMIELNIEQLSTLSSNRTERWAEIRDKLEAGASSLHPLLICLGENKSPCQKLKGSHRLYGNRFRVSMIYLPEVLKLPKLLIITVVYMYHNINCICYYSYGEKAGRRDIHVGIRRAVWLFFFSYLCTDCLYYLTSLCESQTLASA